MTDALGNAQSPGDAAARFFGMLSEHEPDQFLGAATDDVEYESIDGSGESRVYRGLQEVGDVLRMWFEMFDELEYTLRATAVGDDLAMLEYGDVGRTKDGEEFVNEGVVILRLAPDTGKIRHVKSYFYPARLTSHSVWRDRMSERFGS